MQMLHFTYDASMVIPNPCTFRVVLTTSRIRTTHEYSDLSHWYATICLTCSTIEESKISELSPLKKNDMAPETFPENKPKK